MADPTELREEAAEEAAPDPVEADQETLARGEREDELVRRQKEFTVLTDSMSEGLVLLDKSGKVLVANRSALSLLPECAEGETFPLPESAPSNPAAAAAAPAVKDALRGARREVSHSADGETWRTVLSLGENGR